MSNFEAIQKLADRYVSREASGAIRMCERADKWGRRCRSLLPGIGRIQP